MHEVGDGGVEEVGEVEGVEKKMVHATVEEGEGGWWDGGGGKEQGGGEKAA